MDWDRFLVGVGLLAGGALALGPGGGLARLTNGPQAYAAILALAEKWGPVFNIPPAFILAIAKTESDYRPGARNTSPSALQRGGAWGAMQVTLNTALDNAPRLAKLGNQAVAATLSAWDHTGPGLLVPDVGVLFGSYQLGKLTGEFHDFPLVAAGYHQGAQKVRDMVKAGRAIPDELPPKGKAYVTKAVANYGSLA